MTCSVCNTPNIIGGRKRLRGLRRTKNRRSSRKMRNYRGGGIMDWFSNAGNTIGESTQKVEEGLNNAGNSISSTASSSWSNVSNWFSSKPKETTSNNSSSSYNPMYSTNTVGGKRTRYRRKNNRVKKTRKY